MSSNLRQQLERIRARIPTRWLTYLEFKTLLAFMFVVGGTWIFAELADEVSEGSTQTVDEWVLRALQEPGTPASPIGPPWVENMARDWTALGSFSVLAIISILVAGFLALMRQWASVVLLTITIVGGTLATHALKLGFDRPRPDLTPHGDLVHTASFPSGHAMMAATVYLTLGGLLARSLTSRSQRVFVICGAICLSLLIGFSRIYLGVHWPSDVLGGWAAGATWANLAWLTARWRSRRRLTHTSLQ